MPCSRDGCEIAVSDNGEAGLTTERRNNEERQQHDTDPSSDEESRYRETTDYRALESCKESLLSALEVLKSDSSFANISGINNFRDPGLIVDDKGPISLPLTRSDAHRIIAASHQAPFGRYAETIVDTSVRQTWEINSDQFRFHDHGAWQQLLSMLLPAVCDMLGISEELPNISAQLYKVLLYEKGALFKPHKDSEKVPGMFGTLVVCLPSAHEGGDIVLRHGGDMKSFSTASCQPSFAAWYADVLHEIKEVTFGYRLVLTLNLVKTTPNVGKFAIGVCTTAFIRRARPGTEVLVAARTQ